jgi:putative SOS response-associated peptidase YedK
MCGRFTRMYTWQELVELYHLTMAPSSNLEPRYNICPTDTIDVVVAGGGQRALLPMRWGLIPGWWNKPLKEMKLATFNARSDSIADRPMFAESFARRRCLIPASGYYEWVTRPGGKQPYYFTRRDGQIITIAGIQEGTRAFPNIASL